MTNANLLQAIGRIDPKLIADAAPDVPQKKPINKTWVKWTSLAACFAFAVAIGAMSGDTNIILSTDMVNNYGQFIFMPVLLAGLIPLCVSFAKRDIKTKTMMIANAISLVTINILNVLGVFLHSQLGGINIIGDLPIILLGSNAGAIISIFTIILLDRKIKTWWIKLLLWVLVSAVSIIVSWFTHNLIFMLLSGDLVTMM